MCSVSWKWSKDTSSSSPSFSLYFNRDEQRSRPTAEPPSIHQGETQTYLAPIDPLRGGTWMGVNTTGIIVTLLNNYSVATNPDSNYQSRGQIVSTLLDQEESLMMVKTLKQLLNADLYPAFSLLIFDSITQQVHSFTWDESELRPLVLEKDFFTSSSWETERVQQYRLNSYIQQVVKNGDKHEDFHCSTPNGEEKSSVFMQREKTWTVSRSYLHLYPDRAEIEYFERTSSQVHKSSISLTYEKTRQHS